MRSKLLVSAAVCLVCTGCSHHRETGAVSLAAGEARSWKVDGLNVRLEALNLGPGMLWVKTGTSSLTEIETGNKFGVTLNKAESAEPIIVRFSAPGDETSVSWVFTGPHGWRLTEQPD